MITGPGTGSRRGPQLTQHKAWQQGQVNRRYHRPSAFLPTDRATGAWKSGFGTAFGIAGKLAGAYGAKSIAKRFPTLATPATALLPDLASKLGTSGGKKIGELLERANNAIINVLTVLGNPLSTFAELDARTNEHDMFRSDASDQ